jgi:hypothetical protein
MALFKAFDFVLFQNLPQLLLLVKYLVQRLSLLDDESAMITTSYKFDGYSCCNAKVATSIITPSSLYPGIRTCF